MGMKVPDVLLSGNHQRIEKWRLEESKKITKLRRPDLYKKSCNNNRLERKYNKFNSLLEAVS